VRVGHIRFLFATSCVPPVDDVKRDAVTFLARMLWLRRLIIAAVALTIASALVVLARGAADFATIGDTAVIESYTWMASTGDLLLGPYSRFQWHHPGPVAFFWIAPFYALSGARPAGLSAGALTLNLTMLAIMTSIVIRRGGTTLAIVLLATVAFYSWRTAPVLTSAWNPHVIVFAMMALIVAAADTIAGAASTLPVVAALASLVGQTHVALLPSALALGTVSAIGAVAGARYYEHTGTEISRAMFATIAVLALFWILPIAEQLTGHPGNISQLWTFFVTEPHHGQRFAAAFYAWSDMLTGLARPDFAVASGLRFRQSPIRWVEAFAILELVGLAITVMLAARARRGFELALASLLLLTSLLALWSATRIEETIFDHEVFWMSAVGALNISFLVMLVVGLLLHYRAGHHDGVMYLPAVATAAICWMLFAACAATGFREMLAAVAGSSNPPAESETVSTVAKELEQYFARERIVRPLVRVDQDGWPLAAGVILRLQKTGVPVAVEDDWLPMFTPAFAATGREAVVLAIDGKAQHVRNLGKPGDAVVIEHDPQLFVHRLSNQ
jgi:hypothetical protein